jgi:hypothetical protein
MLLRDRCPKFPDNAETSSAGILSQRSGQMYNPDMGGEGPVSKAGAPRGLDPSLAAESSRAGRRRERAARPNSAERPSDFLGRGTSLPDLMVLVVLVSRSYPRAPPS